MLNRLAGTIAILIVAFSCIVSAQERPKAEDILRYFPVGDYGGITHKDNRPQPDLPALEDWRSFQNDIKRRFGREATYRNPLPKRFNEGEFSLTTAGLFYRIYKTVRIKIEKPYEREQLNKAFDKLRRKYPNMRGAREKHLIDKENDLFDVKIYMNLGDSFWIYRSDKLIDLVPQTLKVEELVFTEETIHEQPVYKMNPPGGVSRDYGLYCYVTPYNELLISKKLSGIQTMLDVAEGTIPNITEDPRYASLAEVLPELSIEWALSFPQARAQSVLESEIKDGLSDDRVKMEEKNIATQPLVSVSTMVASETLILKQISVYADEEAARKMFNPNPKSYSYSPVAPEKAAEFHKYERSRTTWKLDGNWIIESTTYDKEYLQKRLDYYKAMKKARKQKEQEAK